MEQINLSGNRRHILGLLVVFCVALSACQGSLVRQISSSRQPYQIVQNWDTDIVSSLAASSVPSSFPSHVLRKRDTSTAANSDASSKIKRSAVPLNDSHNQLLVFWAGEDVILCLAKDVTSNTSSTLWISRDYGGSFLNATSLLLQSGGSGVVQPLPVLEGFFNHPSHNGHFAFTDIQNKYLYTTKNYGAEFTANKLDFVPDEVMFDPHSDVNIVAYEKSTKNKQMWVSIDYGATWTKVQEHVKSLSWGDESVMPADLYLQREEPAPGPGERSIILKSNSLFLDAKDTVVIITGVEEFEIKDDFMFATKQKENGTYDLLISYKQSQFKKAIFPVNQLTKHFFIADVSTDGQIFVCVVQNKSVSNLFIGNFPTNPEENPTFSLSLERILFFKPNVTWSESWLNEVGSDTFVDLHHVEGLRGVYIASQLKPSTVSSGKFNMNEVISLITYDQGAEWQVLNPPEFEHDGRPIYCQYKSVSNCSLHISQRLSELYPRTRAVPVLSKKSAVGLVLATGTVNTTLKGHLGVYLSTDGAVNWRQILQGNYVYGFGDHGGLIVATKMYKIGEDTNELIYSVDEGDTWESYQFYEEKVRIMGLMTEPGENTTVFFIFGSVANTTRHTWILIKVDFRDIFDRTCEKEDYKQWSPWDSKPDRKCLAGRKEIYERRIPTHKCYNGQEYVRPVTNKTCACSRIDFECDFGYIEDSKTKECVKDNSESSPGVKAEWCKPSDQFYNKTRGYRKVPGDVCEEGDWVSKFLPETIACEVKEELEFLLVAKRDSVLRIDLNHFERVETLPLPRVQAAIAVDFNLKNNCIFWSDVHHKAIMRLHLDGKSSAEVLVSSDIVSVEGLAFDWMANNLYFTDGGGSKIEVIRTDSESASFHRRLRKRLLTKPDVEKPRGIAVHPEKGYIFWTDWSTQNPGIGRSHLDGSQPKKIVTGTNELGQMNVKWPNGITVDYSRNSIYWVDAYLDLMMTADLDGGHLRIVLQKDTRITHPFAVGVYKNMVYWDDWTTRGIYKAPFDSSGSSSSISQIKGNLPRLMDLKVYGTGQQQGENACSKSNCSSSLCILSPNDTVSCVCPDGFVKQNDSCVCPDGKPANANGTCLSRCEEGKTFKCKSHSDYCIINAWRCDGDNDCADGSDEEDCESARCSDPNEFRCKVTGRCIPQSFLCDFDHDCGPNDHSDEEHCEDHNTCDSVRNFQCANGRCILKAWRCDEDDDCLDNSDEMNCTTTTTNGTQSCLPSEFKCPNENKCISTEWLCDFDNDCTDGFDELNCTQRTCPDWKFACKSGHCIMSTWECDGDKDCPDGSDEHKDCPVLPLTPPTSSPFPQGNCSTMSQMFECLGSKDCVPIYWKCDGVKDCADGSDELGCKNQDDQGTTVTISPPTSHCELDHWRCDDGTCIAAHAVCDGFPDCHGQEDEASCHNSTTGDCPKNNIRCGESRACVLRTKWCDKKYDCPNKADETDCEIKTFSAECNSGSLACSDGGCVPLYQKCDGTNDCPNGEDEPEEECRHHEPVYQAQGITASHVDATWFEVEWYLPKSPALKNLRFVTEVCEVESAGCWNGTEIADMSYKIMSNETAHHIISPYKMYTVTVFVKNGEKVYPPAVYINVTTTEAASTAPFNLEVRQNTTEDLIISWKKPHTPNGKIILYKVYFSPPVPPANIDSDKETLVISNKQSDPVFLPGVNYTFWVTAENGFGEGERSEVKNYVYNGEVALLKSFKIDAVGENSAKFSWEPANNNVKSYTVLLETKIINSMYTFRNSSETTQKTIQFKKLASGTRYKITLIPKLDGMHGVHRSNVFTTKGTALPKVEGLKVIATPNGDVDLMWRPVKLEKASYGIYHGKTAQEISDRREQGRTSLTKFHVSNLEACENYLFDVGLITDNGFGPLTESPIQILTKMNPLSPPKNVHVSSEGGIKVKVSWDAPCSIMEKAIGYNITIDETTQNRTYGVSNVSYSILPNLYHELDLQYGGSYKLTVSTNINGGKQSAPVSFEGPPIPFPEKVRACSHCNALTIFWEEPKLPMLVKTKGNESYVVYLSKDSNLTNPKVYQTNDNNFQFDDITDDGIYYVAVRVQDHEGLLSPMSAAISIQQSGGASPIVVIPGSSALAITISILIVIVLLVAVLGVVVVRHKRLQTSFLNFASSHYSSHSGAATFQQTVEDQDSPVIRGFSDDEPLLVA
ncbi:unnamed protein product [Orchesella dallaii]|uniref:Sortilin-related receptor n=1 Tax=Orchesella dallaii TaxID=48710 RepID=A0ABP1Q896_9HEXA